MVALDVSNSMMARDINPTRLDKAKMMLSKLVDDLDNDKVGLIVLPVMHIRNCLLQPITYRQRCSLNRLIHRWCLHKEQL